MNIYAQSLSYRIAIIGLPIIFMIYSYFWNNSPFYYAWDSSLLYANDILIVSSGLTPDHMLHPNMFPLVLYKWLIIPFGKFFGFITISTIEELQYSLNPHLAHTEFVEYIYNVCRIVVLTSCSLLYINIIKIISYIVQNLSKIVQIVIYLLIFIISFVFVELIYLNSIIRYESFGLMLMMFSVFFIIKATEQNTNYKKENYYIVLSGFFAGSAFLSKILFLGSAIMIPVIYFLLKQSFYHKYESRDYKTIFMANSILLILIVLINVIFAYSMIFNTLEGTAFLYNVKLLYVLPFILLFLGFLSSLTFLSWYLWNSKKNITGWISSGSYPFMLYMIGIVSPLFTALLLGNKFNPLIHSYLFSFAMGSLSFGITSGYNRPFPTINSSNVFVFVGITILLIGLLVVFYKKTIKNTRLKPIFYGVLGVLLTIILNKILLRSGGSDLVIGLFLLIIMLAVFFAILYNNIDLYKKQLIILGCGILMIMSISRVSQIIPLMKNLGGVVESSYFYNIKDWKSQTYGLRTYSYQQLMESRYPSDKEWYKALSWSKNIFQTRKLLQQVQNGANKLTDTILAIKNGYLDLGGKNKITDIDNSLEGTLLLPMINNISSVYLRDDYDFYLLSEKPYSIEERITESTKVFEVNNNRYYVYKLSMSYWKDLNDGFGFNGNIEIKKSLNNTIYIAIMNKF